MTEFEKMRNKEFYDFSGQEITDSIVHANNLCTRLQTMTAFDPEYRSVIEELIPGIPLSSCINPPFHCDHGHGIKLGEGVFVNYGATMLDGGMITIGSRTKIGPNCQLVTPNHPIDYMERRLPQERCLPITIGQFTPVNIVACPVADCGSPSTPRQASIGFACCSMRRHRVGQTSLLRGLSAAGAFSPTPSMNR